MTKQLMVLFVFLSINMVCIDAQELQVEGAIKIGDIAGEPEPGTIRWSGLNFEGWNGLTWVPLTSFQINSIIEDRDGNQYRTVIIGSQEWMAENLRTARYDNGGFIQRVISATEWNLQGEGAWCWYGNDFNNEEPYGKLYNWYAVNDSSGLCPTGWHVPSDDEWTTLTDYLGGRLMAGGPLKETGTTHWQSPNGGATNKTGFTALPGGFRTAGLAGSTFLRIFTEGRWWSSSVESSTINPYYRGIGSAEGLVSEGSIDEGAGLSVRCLKD